VENHIKAGIREDYKIVHIFNQHLSDILNDKIPSSISPSIHDVRTSRVRWAFDNHHILPPLVPALDDPIPLHLLPVPTVVDFDDVPHLETVE
jgi:hypothetical protein